MLYIKCISWYIGVLYHMLYSMVYISISLFDSPNDSQPESHADSVSPVPVTLRLSGYILPTLYQIFMKYLV